MDWTLYSTNSRHDQFTPPRVSRSQYRTIVRVWILETITLLDNRVDHSVHLTAGHMALALLAVNDTMQPQSEHILEDIGTAGQLYMHKRFLVLHSQYMRTKLHCRIVEDYKKTDMACHDCFVISAFYRDIDIPDQCPRTSEYRTILRMRALTISSSEISHSQRH